LNVFTENTIKTFTKDTAIATAQQRLSCKYRCFEECYIFTSRDPIHCVCYVNFWL